MGVAKEGGDEKPGPEEDIPSIFSVVKWQLGELMASASAHVPSSPK
jgi:hypothetical protein